MAPHFASSPLSHMRILLVEDDAPLLSGLREAFGQAEHELDHLPVAEPALNAFAHQVHDLAIVNIGLAGMGGLELVRRVRETCNKIPALVFTAPDGLADQVRGPNEDADDHRIKPFLLPELMKRA